MLSVRSSFVVATLALAVLFAAVVLLPHGLQRTDFAYPFKGIEIMGADGELYYAARVREVTDGYWSVGNAYYSDLKDTPFVQPPLAEWVIAMIGKVLGIGPVGAFVLMKGVFAFLIVIAVTGAFVALTGETWVALTAVALMLFANALLNAPWDLPGIFRDSLSLGFLRFARPINPQWPMLWFFATLWMFASWMRVRSTRKIIIAALMTLMTLYSYVYAWTYIAATIGLLLLYFLIKRDRTRSKDLILFALLCIAGGLPYFWHVWVTIHHPWYADSAMRQGLVHSRHLVLGVWLLLFLPLSFCSRRLWPQTFPLLPSLAFGGLIVLNQQLVTGSALVPHHYHWYFIQPIASVTALILLFILIRRFLSRVVFQSLLIVACISAVAFGFLQQQRAYRDSRVQWGEVQGAAGVLNFLDRITKPGLIVAGAREDFIDVYAPLYTSADVYALRLANLYLVSRERAEDAFFFRLWVLGITPDAADTRLFTDLRAQVSSALYAIYYRESTGDFAAIPDSDVTLVTQAYREYYDLSLTEKLKLHPLDFLVIEKGDPETPALKAFRRIGKVVYQDERFTVLSLSI